MNKGENYDNIFDVYRKPIKKDRKTKIELTEFLILNDDIYL